MATSRKNQNGKRTASKSGGRATPGSRGQGNYYHVELRSGEDFEAYRTQDVGDKGHLQRVAGKRPGGSWATVKWLVSKEDAHVEDGKLIGDTRDAKDLIRKLRSRPVLIRGDRFEAKPRRSGSGRSRRSASAASSTRTRKPRAATGR